ISSTAFKISLSLIFGPSPPCVSHALPTRRSSDLAWRDLGADRASHRRLCRTLWRRGVLSLDSRNRCAAGFRDRRADPLCGARARSEEHTSELQSRFELVCRLLREKKKESVRMEW